MSTTQMSSPYKKDGVAQVYPASVISNVKETPLVTLSPRVYCGLGWVAEACAGAALCCVSTAGAVFSAAPVAAAGAAVTGGV